MGRVYSATGEVTTFTTGDIVELIAPSDAVVKLYSAQISQSTSETDDSMEVRLSRFTTSGTGGTAITARPMEVGDTAFGGTVEEANGTPASTGEIIVLQEGISTLAGFQKIWLPEMRPVISPSGRLVFKTPSTITSVTLQWAIEFEEIGG